MGSFGGFYKGEKKKVSKEEMAKRAKKIQIQNSSFKLPELVGRKKDS